MPQPPPLKRSAPPAHSAHSPEYSDPLMLVGQQLGSLRSSITGLLGSQHPLLHKLAKYYFQSPSEGGTKAKQVRPMIVLLMAQATNGLSPHFDALWSSASASSINKSLTPENVLYDVNPTSEASDLQPLEDIYGRILPTQRRLAEITELIHVASLLHDDVIDGSEIRRSLKSAPSEFGNKLSILGGDFLLARASLYLSRLGNNEVVELMASVLANLVEGEVMQMKGNTPDSEAGSSTSKGFTEEIFAHYMTKTYLKTASLMAKSARSSVVLGLGESGLRRWDGTDKVKMAAYSYGRHLGLAFQVRSALIMLP